MKNYYHFNIYIGDSIKVDRKASTPSSSSSDVSKNQTFLDKNIKSFLAVIIEQRKIQQQFFSFIFIIIASFCLA